MQKTYADANAKLDSLKGHGIKVPCKAPVAQSHQRQLSLKASEIQERLIKNKSLLNVVEPTLENHSLEVLLGILQRRIELDKEVLFQFTQLKKEIKLLGGKNDPSVAPLLMRFQRGCQQVRNVIVFFSKQCTGCLFRGHEPSNYGWRPGPFDGHRKWRKLTLLSG